MRGAVKEGPGNRRLRAGGSVRAPRLPARQ